MISAEEVIQSDLSRKYNPKVSMFACELVHLSRANGIMGNLDLYLLYDLQTIIQKINLFACSSFSFSKTQFECYNHISKFNQHLAILLLTLINMKIKFQNLFSCCRGLPFWLHDVPNIVYRSDNEPWKVLLVLLLFKTVNQELFWLIFVILGGRYTCKISRQKQ